MTSSTSDSGKIPLEISGWWAIPIILIASVITVFADRNAGLNFETLRVALSALTVFVIINVSTNVVVKSVTRNKKNELRARITARPIMLLILIATVLFARTTEIDPAIIVGTVLGIDFGARLLPKQNAVGVLARFVWLTVLGILALVSYSFLAATSIATSGSNSTAFMGPEGTEITFTAATILTLGEICAMLSIACLASTPISLLPLAFLDGAFLWNWNKWVWGLCYFVSISIFSLVLVPMDFSWELPSSTVIAWISVFIVYALVAVLTWLLFYLGRSRKAVPPKEEVVVGKND